MKQHRLLVHLISLLLALSILGAVGSAEFFAVGEETQNVQPAPIAQENVEAAANPDENQNNADQGNQSNETTADDNGSAAAVNDDRNQGEHAQPEQNQWYDPIYSYDEDVTSAYSEPEHLGELPAVSPTQVVEATSVAIPVVAVSDASLFSGIVMWLCVALGIAVIVGVLVSRRTRRNR